MQADYDRSRLVPEPSSEPAAQDHNQPVMIGDIACYPNPIKSDDVMALLDRWARLSTQGMPIPAGERQLIEAAYDAAQTTFALKNHWQMSDAHSADAANSLPVRKTLRERSRYESANNSYLCGMGRTIANDVIGRGPRLQMLLDNQRINNRVEKLWKAWAKEIRLAKKLRTARETQVRDGEVFLLFITNKKLRSPIKLDIQVIEADQVEDYFFIPTPEQPVSGMELDENGYPDKYHVLKFHPGSAVLWATNPYEFDKIEAQFVIHLFKADRPNQHRGIPECASSLSLFAILRSCTMSVLDAMRIAGTLNYAIGTKSSQVAPAKITNVPAFAQLNIPPGTVPFLPEGWEIMQSDISKPITGFSEFRGEIVNEAARPVHMPKNMATGSSQDYTFSAAILDKATYYNAIGIDQHDVGEDALDPILLAFLMELENLGELETLPDEAPIGGVEEICDEREWEFDSPDPIDAEKTANADKINLTTGKLALGPSDIIRMTQTAKCLGLTLAQYQALIIGNAFPGTDGNSLGPGPGGQPGGQPSTGPAPAQSQPSAAEFSTTSRMQWQRNRKAIDDLLDEFATGKATYKKALVLLQTLGLARETAQALLDELNEQEEPVPSQGNAGTTT